MIQIKNRKSERIQMDYKQITRKIKPEKAFLLVGIIGGIIFLFLTPPFQVPDEYNHFYRAYQISEGNLIKPIINDFYNGFLPKSLTIICSRNNHIPFHPENKQKISDIVSAIKIPLNPGKRHFVFFGNTASYSPINYIATSIAMLLGRLFHLPPIILMYLGRLFNLVVWILLIYLSIKIIPFFKWFLFLLALIPMSLFQAASLSPDSISNALCFFLLAFFLKCSYNENKKIESKDILLFFLLFIFISLLKSGVYLPLTLFIFLIPKEKFGSNKRYLLIIISLFLVSIGIGLVWFSLIKVAVNIPFHEGIEINHFNDQLVFILNNPFQYTLILLRTFWVNHLHILKEFIGVLGWLDTPLPNLLIFTYFAFLLFIASMDKDSNIKINIAHKLFILFMLIVSVLLILSSQWLVWTPLGNPIVIGIQGRYFIPCSMLFFLLFYNTKFKLNINHFNLIIIGFSFLSLIISSVTLIKRYW